MFVVTVVGGLALIAVAWRHGGKWRRALVAALVAASAVLQLIGPSPGGGPLLASGAIVLYTAVPAEKFHRWVYRTFTVLPVVV
jgi:hypothetical protein